MQVWCDWQLTLCDPHLSALEVRFHDGALYKSMFTFTLTFIKSELYIRCARFASIIIVLYLKLFREMLLAFETCHF